MLGGRARTGSCATRAVRAAGRYTRRLSPPRGARRSGTSPRSARYRSGRPRARPSEAAAEVEAASRQPFQWTPEDAPAAGGGPVVHSPGADGRVRRTTRRP